VEVISREASFYRLASLYECAIFVSASSYELNKRGWRCGQRKRDLGFAKRSQLLPTIWPALLARVLSHDNYRCQCVDLLVGLCLLSCCLVDCGRGTGAMISVSGRYTASSRFVISQFHDLPVLADSSHSLKSLIGSAYVARFITKKEGCKTSACTACSLAA
jgi:hypothetical protein